MTGYAVRVVTLLMTFLYTLLTLGTCAALPPVEQDEPAAVAQDNIPLGQSGPVILRIMQPHGDIGLQMQQAADLFVASYPDKNIQIHVQTVNGKEAYQTALRAKLVTGDAVDLFHVFGQSDLAQLSGRVRPVTLSWARNAVAGLTDAVTVGGRLYGVPYSIEGMGLIADRAVFEAAAIPLSGIADFEDLSDAMTELHDAIDTGSLAEDFPALSAATEFPAQDSAFLAYQLAELLLTEAFATAADAAVSPSVQFSHGVAVEEYVRLMARCTTNRTHWSRLLEVPQSAQVEQGLAAGRVAIIQQSTGVYQRLVAQEPALASRLVLLPIPLEGLESPGIYYGAPSYWAVNTASSDKSAKLAEDFLTWLYCSEEGMQVLKEEFGAFSPYEDSPEAPLHRQLLSYIEAGRTHPSLRNELPRDWGALVLVAEVRRWFKDETEWDKMLEDCAEQWFALRRTTG